MKWHGSSKKSNSEEQSEQLRFLRITFYKKHIIDAALQKSRQSYNYEADNQRENLIQKKLPRAEKMQSPN